MAADSQCGAQPLAGLLLAFFLVAAEGLLRFTGGDPKTLLSLSNVIVFVVPLVTLVYGTIYLYNSREFIELLLAQPLKRWTIFAGLYSGLALPLITALIAGTLIPFVVHGIPAGSGVAMATMLIGATALTAAFTGITGRPAAINHLFEDQDASHVTYLIGHCGALAGSCSSGVQHRGERACRRGWESDHRGGALGR